PFLQYVALAGPRGEVVRVQALLDDGAMANIMDEAAWQRVAHRLQPLSVSTRTFRMADGRVVRSRGSWTGLITFGGVVRRGSFEVFSSGGAWSFLFGKPLLCAFDVLHDYGMDHDWVVVRDGGRTVRLFN
ncbi:hypothetical protein BDW22DRAFT_1299658, partial [Trametopsis cervina]